MLFSVFCLIKINCNVLMQNKLKIWIFSPIKHNWWIITVPKSSIETLRALPNYIFCSSLSGVDYANSRFSLQWWQCDNDIIPTVFVALHKNSSQSRQILRLIFLSSHDNHVTLFFDNLSVLNKALLELLCN